MTLPPEPESEPESKPEHEQATDSKHVQANETISCFDAKALERLTREVHIDVIWFTGSRLAKEGV